MEEHISFEELMALFFPPEVDDNYFRIAARVNAHMMHCRSCKDMYSALLHFSDIADYKSGPLKQSDRNTFFILKILYGLKSTSQEMESAIVTCIEHIQNISAYVYIKVKDYSEIAVDNLLSVMSYQHPEFSTVPKSAGTSCNTIGVIKSSVVSEGNNRISIGLDGTLSLYFNCGICTENSWVLLAPTGENQIPYYKRLEKYDEYQFVARFSSVSPGEYLVILQNQ